MQVILDSSFARPGSAPIWGGKKGEFRDWTSVNEKGKELQCECLSKISLVRDILSKSDVVIPQTRLIKI